MKTIVINGSPRKNWNTAKMMKAAKDGAESIGAETEYIDLYDLNFTGCRSCLKCKQKNAENYHCYWKDDLSPIIDRIFKADTLLIGSPIYLGEPTSQFRALFERLIFLVLSYDTHSGFYNRKLNVGIIYTMNAPIEYYDNNLKLKLQDTENLFKFLNGEVRAYAACDTLQVTDYDKYNMAGFNEKDKKEIHKKNFSINLMNAFHMGMELSKV